jgi:hypothetical protein
LTPARAADDTLMAALDTAVLVASASAAAGAGVGASPFALPFASPFVVPDASPAPQLPAPTSEDAFIALSGPPLGDRGVYRASQFIRAFRAPPPGVSYVAPPNGGDGWAGGALMPLDLSRGREPILEVVMPNFRATIGDGSFIGTDALPLFPSVTLQADVEAGHAVRAPGKVILRFGGQCKSRILLAASSDGAGCGGVSCGGGAL